MKYSYPPRALTFIGPQRSECTSSKGPLALRPFPVKDLLVIFPSRQDSQGGKELSSNGLRSPLLTNLPILLRFM